MCACINGARVHGAAVFSNCHAPTLFTHVTITNLLLASGGHYSSFSYERVLLYMASLKFNYLAISVRSSPL